MKDVLIRGGRRAKGASRQWAVTDVSDLKALIWTPQEIKTETAISKLSEQSRLNYRTSSLSDPRQTVRHRTL